MDCDQIVATLRDLSRTASEAGLTIEAEILGLTSEGIGRARSDLLLRWLRLSRDTYTAEPISHDHFVRLAHLIHLLREINDAGAEDQGPGH